MVNKPIEEIDNDIVELVRKAVFHAHSVIVSHTPVAESVPSDPPFSLGHTGGRLRQSIVVEEVKDGFIIGTNMPYAEFVEFGTDAHIIKTTDKQALKFYGGDQFHFAKEVHHPGTEGRAMFQKGIDAFERYMAEHSPH